MSKATFTFGRFNPPTEEGHGKLVGKVQAHAEETGGRHYIFPSHSQDSKKNPLSHKDKVGAMNRLFPNANVISHGKVRTAIDAMKHLEKQGHKEVTMVVGSDRVDNFKSLLNKYRTKEYPGIKKVNVISAGNRDPDAEGAEGMSASKLRGLVSAGKRNEFISHYSDPKLGAHIHDKVKAGMQMESTNPIGIFLLGGPGSGKDYVLKNIFSRFDLTEVQADQILNGAAAELFESKQNIVINGVNDADKIELVQNMLEGYTFDFVHVSVTNKVSRLRNEQREQPLVESKRIDKYLKAEQLAKDIEAFIFNNSINLNESSEMERLFFGSQIEKLLERVVDLGLEMKITPEPKSFLMIREKTKEPTGPLKKACWTGYTAIGMKMKNGRKVPNCVPVKEQIQADVKKPHTVENIAKKHNVDVDVILKALEAGKKVEKEHTNDEKTAEIIALGHLWEKPDYYQKLKQVEAVEQFPTKVRKVARSGNITAVKERQKENTFNEETDINQLFEMQLVGTDEYRKHAIAMTPGQKEIGNAYKSKTTVKAEETGGDCDCGGDCGCNDDNKNESIGATNGRNILRSFRDLRTEAKKEKEENTEVTAVFDPKLGDSKKKSKNIKTAPRNIDSTMQGLPVASRFNAYEEKEPKKDFMPTPRQVPPPPGGHPVPKGYKRVKDHIAGWKLVKEDDEAELTLDEAVQYHLENKISFTENVFRPASEMFFEMIKEAKRLYKEGKYVPKDEWETDMLNSDIGETAEFEGQTVVLDYPIEEGLEECWSGYVQRGMKKKGDKMVPNCVPVNEEDETGGKGIGKPWREGGGGAVYVRVGDSVRKIRFSQSGMKKKFMDPGATRSFVARHRCLTNTNKASASYWACRWPRFFSNSGKTWW